MPGEKILIVEDKDNHRKLLRDLLTIEGYITQEVSRAEDVIPMLTTFKPLLILMDIQLPGMTGLDLARKLKTNAKYKNITIIAVTAYAMKHDKKVALAAGCADYITKPIDTVALPLLIRKYLDKKDMKKSP